MKSLAKNYFLNLIYQILVVVLPLITAPYLARVLGADRIGEYSFARSVVAYFVLASVLGTSLYGQREIASAHARGTSKSQIFWELVLFRCITVVVALGTYFAAVFPFADNKLLYAVAAVEILTTAFDISWFYQGIERFQNITLSNGISKILGAVGIFLFVKTREDLVLYVFFLTGSLLLGCVSQWFFVWPYLKNEACTRLNSQQHVRPTIKLFISQAAIQAYTVLDKTMIGLITGSDFENGYYDQAQNLIRALVVLITSIGAVMASRITIIWHSDMEDRKNQVEELILFSFRLVLALGLPIMAGLILVAPRFVPIYFGSGFEPVIQLIQVLAVIVPVIGCSNIIGIQLLVPTGREQMLTRSVVIGACVNIVLNSLMIPQMGSLGAVIASVVAECVVTGAQIFFARRDVQVRRIFAILGRYILLSLSVLIVGGLLTRCTGDGILGLAVVVLACVSVYGGLLLAMKDPVLKLFSM